MGHKIDQQGIRPLPVKLEAITKIDIPKIEREIESFLGDIQYLPNFKLHGKFVSKHRYSEKIAEETKRLDMDGRTHRSIQQMKRRYYKNTMLSTL